MNKKHRKRNIHKRKEMNDDDDNYENDGSKQKRESMDLERVHGSLTLVLVGCPLLCIYLFLIKKTG
jgi:hypothetical protein